MSRFRHQSWTFLVAAAACLLVGCAEQSPEREAEYREQQTLHYDTKYASELRPYLQALKTGMSRKEVEDFLRAKDIPFDQMCCFTGVHKSSLDDLVKIGKEHVPWFCSSNYVYAGFEFDDQHDHPYVGWGVSPWGADDMDTLKGIHAFSWTQGCL